MMDRKHTSEKRFWRVFSPFHCTVFLFFFFSVAIYIIARFSTDFAEFWARYPSQGIRFLLGSITSILPFSLAESFLLLLPVFAVSYLVWAFRKINREVPFSKLVMPLISILLIIATLFFTMFGPCYFRKSVAENVGLRDEAVSASDLYDTAVWLCAQIDEVKSDIVFDASGASHLPFSYSELITVINSAFQSYAEDVDYISSFYSNPKAIALSEPMTYTHISGVYSFFTGESNINVNYPDFVLPFTMAHEMSHQRGIAREEEANFVAFLVCLRSGSSYVRYSAYAEVLSYIISALYAADSALYEQLRSTSFPAEYAGERVAYSAFFKKYAQSTASQVTGSVNNSFLQSQGQSAGTNSYGLVVDLAVAYFKSLTP